MPAIAFATAGIPPRKDLPRVGYIDSFSCRYSVVNEHDVVFPSIHLRTWKKPLISGFGKSRKSAGLLPPPLQAHSEHHIVERIICDHKTKSRGLVAAPRFRACIAQPRLLRRGCAKNKVYVAITRARARHLSGSFLSSLTPLPCRQARRQDRRRAKAR